MCTIGRTPAGTAGKAHHRTDPAECTVRGGQERTDCGSKRGRNSFLNTALPPDCTGESYGGDIRRLHVQWHQCNHAGKLRVPA